MVKDDDDMVGMLMAILLEDMDELLINPMVVPDMLGRAKGLAGVCPAVLVESGLGLGAWATMLNWIPGKVAMKPMVSRVARWVESALSTKRVSLG
jgi:ABC-type cobalamin transport system permease subunit